MCAKKSIAFVYTFMNADNTKKSVKKQKVQNWIFSENCRNIQDASF